MIDEKLIKMGYVGGNSGEFFKTYVKPGNVLHGTYTKMIEIEYDPDTGVSVSCHSIGSMYGSDTQYPMALTGKEYFYIALKTLWLSIVWAIKRRIVWKKK